MSKKHGTSVRPETDLVLPMPSGIANSLDLLIATQSYRMNVMFNIDPDV